MTGPRMTRLRLAVLETLSEHGGAISDKSGRATSILVDELHQRGQDTTGQSLAGTLLSMEELGMLTRDIKGKRTFAIKLIAEPEPPKEPEPYSPEVQEPVPEPLDLAEQARVPDDLNYPVLAVALLEAVTDVLSRPEPEDMKVRLGQTLEENTRLRDKLRAAQDTLRAVEAERDGLRQRKQVLEANIERMLNGSEHDAGRSRRNLERFMQERPARR